jgi:DNA repair protein RecO
MAYQTYTTEALVCGTFNRNTADRSYLLFTREAGMLYAEAKSVREERSRQRMALQDFSLVRVSLVKGKSSWKIGSIEAKQNFFMAASDKEARGSVVSLIKFLRRFYGGQEAAPALFDFTVRALAQLSADIPHRTFLERIIQVTLLEELGYVDTKSVPSFVHEKVLTVHAADDTAHNILILDTLIEKAVATSHL